ncbi:hypothetical protein ACFSQP_12585 [Bizionia sediminis]|uniref:Uncharacterized protein n=1 Tax=Bizionia sediminis TaxID=1737064 RepID=A0ABW5KXC4_9FLAO
MKPATDNQNMPLLEKRTKVVMADRPSKLEFLINEELSAFYAKGIQVIDVKYAISKEVGSAIIIYNPNI